MPDFISPDMIRARFSTAISAMYRAEVPLYGDLLSIVDAVNRSPADEGNDTDSRLGSERHGAIRLGTAAELSMMRRAFAVMGMHPVGYYDLAPAGLPVHSTAFRPITAVALAVAPFRMFTSLLRVDLIADPALREMVTRLLARRSIFSENLCALVASFEANGGLSADDSTCFIAQMLDVFRWHDQALGDHATYRRLLAVSPLVADIACFRGPHINHLTPRTLDIDAVQAAMLAQGMVVKQVIEGPPRRNVPILLRQTSFAARSEPIHFPDDTTGIRSHHKARFGEVEQRGIALTPKGRALYDRLLAVTLAGQSIEQSFSAFPDSLDRLRDDGLAYFTYNLGPNGEMTVEPILYEDFLPVSAAGIFRSNMAGADHEAFAAVPAQTMFEQALGVPVIDMFALYADQQAVSLRLFEQQRNTSGAPGAA